MRTPEQIRNAQTASLLDSFRKACRPPDRTAEPPPPKDEVGAWMLRVFRAALKRQQAEAELVRELSRFTLPGD